MNIYDQSCSTATVTPDAVLRRRSKRDGDSGLAGDDAVTVAPDDVRPNNRRRRLTSSFNPTTDSSSCSNATPLSLYAKKSLNCALYFVGLTVEMGRGAKHFLMTCATFLPPFHGCKKSMMPKYKINVSPW